MLRKVTWLFCVVVVGLQGMAKADVISANFQFDSVTETIAATGSAGAGTYAAANYNYGDALHNS